MCSADGQERVLTEADYVSQLVALSVLKTKVTAAHVRKAVQIVDTMQTVRIATEFCNAMRSFSVRFADGEIVSGGGIPMILKLMRAYPTDKSVISSACSALCAIAFGNAEAKAAILVGGGEGLLRSALSAGLSGRRPGQGGDGEEWAYVALRRLGKESNCVIS